MRLASSSLLSVWCALSISFGLQISPDDALASSARVFDSAGRPNVAPGRGLSQWSSPREGNNKEVEVRVRVECAEDVKWRHNNDCACDMAWQMWRRLFYQDTNTHCWHDDSSLEPREKIHVCRSAECAQVWCGVYTSVGCNGIAIACRQNKNQKVLCSSQLDACHHFSDDCHHDEDELDEVVGSIPSPSSFRVNSFGSLTES